MNETDSFLTRKLRALRSAVFLGVIGASMALWIWVCLAVFILPYRLRHQIITRWAGFVVACARWFCGIHFEVKGAENLPDGPVLLLSKHQSAWETFYLAYAMPWPTVFVLKKELLRIPAFGWGLAMLHMIPIDRSRSISALRDVTALGKKRLESGHWVVMFPEGTRIPAGQQGKYRNSGARLAIEAGVPVVPVAINAGAFWPRETFVKRPGLVTVSFGPQLSTDNIGPDALTEQARDWIETEMRAIAPQDYVR